jgi:hypothetical protein
MPVLSYHLNVFVRIKELWKRHDKGKAAFYFFVTDVANYPSLIELDGNELWRLGLNFGQERPDPEAVDVASIMARLVGPDTPYEVISRLPWTCRSIVADTWHKGRILLAGDAVHQHGPAGGFGMNTGMGDAWDLGWKLEALVRGWGGPRLLEAYEAERKPVAQRNVGEATENMGRRYSARELRGLQENSPEGEALRARVREEILRDKTKQFISDGVALGYVYDKSPIVVSDGTEAPPSTPGTYVQTSRPGSRAPHAFLADGRSTVDLFGKGFTLLAFNGAEVDAAPFAKAAQARGVPLEVCPISDAAIARLYERRLVLVRPDGHVAWRGDEAPSDPSRIIDTVRGAA